jgi:2-polyprenyl-3-methyl-5-hydroxy-6-metoxy-1,4-benzoquinol methylase
MTESNWQKFFNGHAPDYMNNVFTTNSAFEVEFIISELGLQPGEHILDLGCGTGRHSVPLAKQGLEVTGLDLSEGMLEEARQYAEREKTRVRFLQGDAVDFSFPEAFDHAICICEGSIGLIGNHEKAEDRDLSILRNLNISLKPGGNLLITVLNGLKKIREHSMDDVRKGLFDPVHLITVEKMMVRKGETETEQEFLEKGFTPPEIRHLLVRAGFEIIHLWGGTAGKWNKSPLDMDEYEIMVIAKKA